MEEFNQMEMFGNPNQFEDQIELVEDDEINAFLFDQDTFIRKLSEKPMLELESKDCGTLCPKKSYENWSAPLADRLSTPTVSSMDILKERIPFPKGCIPPLSLPAWHVLPLERRIPYLNAAKSLIYYTRGRLGENLHRPTVTYSVKDPWNRERVVGAPYESLHDRHIRSLLFSPIFHDQLHTRGFINERNEVLCTLKEFNKYRDYLRTQWCDEVWKEVDATEQYIKSEREQFRALMKAESETSEEGRSAIVANRIASAKKFHMELTDFKRKKQQHKDDMNDARLKQWRENKERELIEHVMRGIERARRNRDRLRALHELRLDKRRQIMLKTVRRWYETAERTKSDKSMMQAAYNKFLLEWLESKYVFNYEKLIEKTQLQTDLRANRKYQGRKRQLRLEAYRKAMPSIQEKRRANEQRVWAIVRKYAMRWLEKVRKRLNAPKDLKHESCWIGHSRDVLEEVVKFLYQESGYEKLDDFIMNIMRLKKQIQMQIELEEAEEAALTTHGKTRSEGEKDRGVEEEAEEEEGNLTAPSVQFTGVAGGDE